LNRSHPVANLAMSSYDWVYGVLLITAGSIGNNLGNNLVSLGHKKHHEKELSKCYGDMSITDVSENHSLKPPEKDSCWSITNIGRIVFVVGALFTFASFAFGAQSLIAAMESIQFVSNVFFVYYVHNETVTRRMVLATASIVGGNILVVIFSDHKPQQFTSTDMIELYKTNNVYHGYLAFAFVLWVATTLIYRHYDHARNKLRILLWKHSFVEPLCYAISSAIVGTQAVLNSKCLALLIDATTSGQKNEFIYWYLYFILGTWIAMVSFWLARLDGGLALFPPMFIIPVMQVFFVFFAILCGGIYFEEFNGFSVPQFCGFIIGVLMILVGVYGLAPEEMELHVPGDPAAPKTIEKEIKDCMDKLEEGKLAVLEAKDKPQPVPEEVNIFALKQPVAVTTDSDEELDKTLVLPPNDISTPAMTPMADSNRSKKYRKVVKRPEICGLFGGGGNGGGNNSDQNGHPPTQQIELPPIQVRGSAPNGLAAELELHRQNVLKESSEGSDGTQ